MVFYLTGASVLILDISIQYLMTGLVCAKKNEVQAKGPVTRPLCLSLFGSNRSSDLRALSLSRLFVLSGEGVSYCTSN
jgi:hypothetical protein